MMPMSDDLRTRIIAAIARADQDWCSDNNLHEDMADAVIEELEAGYVLVPKNVTLVRWADEAFRGQPEGKFKHERITEWTTDA